MNVEPIEAPDTATLVVTLTKRLAQCRANRELVRTAQGWLAKLRWVMGATLHASATERLAGILLDMDEAERQLEASLRFARAQLAAIRN